MGMQSIAAMLMDISIYYLTLGIFKQRRIATFAFFSSILSYFVFYCAVRTFVNSLEACLTTFALTFFVYHYDQAFIALSALTCVIRPTSAVMFLPLFINRFFSLPFFWDAFCFLYASLQWFFISLPCSILMDSVLYGRLTFVIYEFLLFNVFQNRASLYGVNAWHWYFSQGLPVLLGTHLIPILIALCYAFLYRPKPFPFSFFFIALLTLIVYSFQAHKEFRFIYPLMPFFLPLCGFGLHLLSLHLPLFTLFMWCGIFLNIIAAVFFNVYHQAGGVAALSSIRSDIFSSSSSFSSSSTIHVHTWMPCHHTPGFAHLNFGVLSPSLLPVVSIRGLDCSPPPLNASSYYTSEESSFYLDPLAFVKHTYIHPSSASLPLPDYLVLYADLVDSVLPVLHSFNYELLSSHFHTFFPKALDDRMSSLVVVLKRSHID